MAFKVENFFFFFTNFGFCAIVLSETDTLRKCVEDNFLFPEKIWSAFSPQSACDPTKWSTKINMMRRKALQIWNANICLIFQKKIALTITPAINQRAQATSWQVQGHTYRTTRALFRCHFSRDAANALITLHTHKIGQQALGCQPYGDVVPSPLIFSKVAVTRPYSPDQRPYS